MNPISQLIIASLIAVSIQVNAHQQSVAPIVVSTVNGRAVSIRVSSPLDSVASQAVLKIEFSGTNTNNQVQNVAWTVRLPITSTVRNYNVNLGSTQTFRTARATWNPAGGCGSSACAQTIFNGNVNGGSVTPTPTPTPTPAPVSPTESYDWRTTACGRATTILDQGRCGSCYSFAATQLLRHRYCMAHGGPSSLQGTFAPQQPLSCSTAQTCNGGLPQTVINWMNTQQNGIVNTCCMPQNQGRGGQITGTCPTANQCSLVNVGWNAYPASGVVNPAGTPSSPFLGCTQRPSQNQASSETRRYSRLGRAQQVTSSTNMNTRCNEIMHEVRTKGPVAMAFDVHSSFYNYHSALKADSTGRLVYTEAQINNYKSNNGGIDNKLGGHAVIIVGYEKRGNMFNYIVQNSWGNDGTAHAGYFFIEACKDIYRSESFGIAGVTINTGSNLIDEESDNLFVDPTNKKNDTNVLKTELTKHYGLPGEKNDQCFVHMSKQKKVETDIVHQALIQLTQQYNWFETPEIKTLHCTILNGVKFNMNLTNCMFNQESVPCQAEIQSTVVAPYKYTNVRVYYQNASGDQIMAGVYTPSQNMMPKWLLFLVGIGVGIGIMLLFKVLLKSYFKKNNFKKPEFKTKVEKSSELFTNLM